MALPHFLAMVVVFINVIAGQLCPRLNSCPRPPTIPQLVLPATTLASIPIGTTLVDGAIAQSLVNTLQMFIVSDLIASKLQSPKCIEYVTTPIIEVATPIIEEVFPVIETVATPCAVRETVVPKPFPKYVPEFKKKHCFNEELILPPAAAQLPCGLGYFPSALPAVVSAFKDSCCSAYPEPVLACPKPVLPVTSPCSCATLAAPICPDIAPLVRPVIL